MIIIIITINIVTICDNFILTTTLINQALNNNESNEKILTANLPVFNDFIEDVVIIFGHRGRSARADREIEAAFQ